MRFPCLLRTRRRRPHPPTCHHFRPPNSLGVTLDFCPRWRPSRCRVLSKPVPYHVRPPVLVSSIFGGLKKNDGVWAITRNSCLDTLLGPGQTVPTPFQI